MAGLRGRPPTEGFLLAADSGWYRLGCPQCCLPGAHIGWRLHCLGCHVLLMRGAYSGVLGCPFSGAAGSLEVTMLPFFVFQLYVQTALGLEDLDTDGGPDSPLLSHCCDISGLYPGAV